MRISELRDRLAPVYRPKLEVRATTAVYPSTYQRDADGVYLVHPNSLNTFEDIARGVGYEIQVQEGVT